MNAFTKLAAVSIVLGAVLLIGPSFGFSTIAADRGVSVETTSDSTALLGINETNEPVEVTGKNGAQEIGTLSNNLAEEATVSVEVKDIPGADNSILQANPPGANVAPGDSTGATVKCAEGTSVGERDVVFRTESAASSVTVTNATFTVTVNIQCNQGSGQIDTTDSGLTGVSASNLTAATDQTQTIEFDLTEDLQSGDTVTITLQDVQKNNRLDYTGASFEPDPSGSADGAVSNNGKDYTITFTANEPMATGDTITIVATGIDASGSQAANQAPYTVDFQRSDKNDSVQNTFSVN